MAIKYYPNPEKRQIIAVMSGTKWDVINKIEKLSCDTGFDFTPGISYKKYLMPEEFRVVLNCDQRDVYDIEEGKKIAKKKILKNYYRSVDKRMMMYKKHLESAVSAMNNKIQKSVDK